MDKRLFIVDSKSIFIDDLTADRSGVYSDITTHCNHAISYTLTKCESYTALYQVTKELYLCGTNDGEILLFKGSECLDMVEAHQRDILLFTHDKSSVLSYSIDMIIRLWTIVDQSLESTNFCICIENTMKECNVCSLQLLSYHRSITIGTSNAEIYEVRI